MVGRQHLDRQQRGVRQRRLGHGDGAGRHRRLADDPRLVAVVAGGDGDDHAGPHGVGHGQRVGALGLAVERAERHVDDVDGVAHVAVLVRVEGPVDRLEHGGAVARALGTASTPCRRRAWRRARGPVGAVGAVAGEDVGHVGAVALEVDRVGVGGDARRWAMARRRSRTRR